LVLRVKGSEAWSYDTICALCKCAVGPDQDVYVVGMHVLHEECLEWLLRQPEHRFREVLGHLPLDTHEELKALYAERRLPATQLPQPPRETAPPPPPPSAEAPAGAGSAGEQPDQRVLTREERRILWSRARAIVDSALRETGLRYVGEMRVDGMSTETYPRFVVAIRGRVSELLREPRKLELKLHTHFKGFGDTDVYVDGEYLYTWRPPEPYVGAFWNWVHRVYNLLKELAERGLLKEEALRSEAGGSGSEGGGGGGAEEGLGDAFIEWEGAPH
jgi:hypothetical protein